MIECFIAAKVHTQSNISYSKHANNFQYVFEKSMSYCNLNITRFELGERFPGMLELQEVGVVTAYKSPKCRPACLPARTPPPVK